MKISVFTTATRPDKRGDHVEQSIGSYTGLADEVIYVDGGNLRETEYDIAWVNGAFVDPQIKIIKHHWPDEFDWKFIGEQFQRGYEACTGDWVIHADLDFVFHEQDYVAIRKAFEDNPDAPALSFWKYQFIQPDRYNLKSRLVIAVNKGKYGDRIIFDSGGDLCQPSLDGKELKPDNVPEARIPFYNYEKILKTEAQVKDDVGRMARAYERHFGEFKLGGPDDESAYQGWLNMQIGRNSKPQQHVALSFHPKVMHDTIRNLTPDQFGHSGFGFFKPSIYAKIDIKEG